MSEFSYTVSAPQLEIIKEDIGDELCHYTSFHALNGILCNKELWLGSLATMNDKNEVKGFINSAKQQYLQHKLTSNEITLISSFFKNIEKIMCEDYPYSLSLSTHIDDAAMWERYASNARGICIKFNKEALLNFATRYQGIIRYVKYTYEFPKDLFNRLLFTIKSNLQTEENRQEYINLFFETLYTSAYYKHPSFKSENEIRLYRHYTLGIRSFEKIDYFIADGIVRKILKINLAVLFNENELTKFLQHLIDKIIIGPRSQQNLGDLKSYIKSIGYSELANKIELSNCPLR